MNEEMKKAKIELEKSREQIKKELQKIKEEADENNAAMIHPFGFGNGGFIMI